MTVSVSNATVIKVTAATPAAPVFKTNPLNALRHIARWLVNPVSEGGAASVPKITYAVGGPGQHKKVEAMRAHPDGARVLAVKPDLGAILADLDSLGAMPEGSLGRKYHAFMCQPEAVPGYLLSALMYKGTEWDDLDWTDDMRYLFERMGQTHDLIHALSGYGTHLASEALNIAFSFGIEGDGRTGMPAELTTRAWAVISGAVMLPNVGIGPWFGMCVDAYRRGAAAAATRPVYCTPFEELLPLPLDEVRRQMGIEPLVEPVDTGSWIRNPFGRMMADGYGKAGGPAARDEKIRVTRLTERVVMAGVTPKVLVNLDRAVVADLLKMVDEGAQAAEVRARAGVPEPVAA